MSDITAQTIFFKQLKEKIPAHLSMAEEIGDLLNISTDSAYRRIRGEKELSFTELQKIVTHFDESIDLALRSASDQEIRFRYNPLNSETFNLSDYISFAYETVKNFAKNDSCEMIYAAKDIPIFHYFLTDEIAAFKIFVWQKTLLDFPGFEDRLFSFDNIDDKILTTGKKLLAEYNRFPSVELWNLETIHSTLLQIEFYSESELFQNPKDALILLTKLEEYIHHIKSQAVHGYKFCIGQEKAASSGSLKMYYNEVILCDNTMLATIDDIKVSFLTHNALNFLTTTNARFCDTTEKYFASLIRRSSLISIDGEKQRNNFFAGLHARINKSKEKVLYMLKRFE